MVDIEKVAHFKVEDKEGKINEDRIYSDWDKLPDLILEKIFSYLSMREKYWASMTCKRWFTAFYLPYTWKTFVLDDYTLTRRKFNYYSGWEHVLDHYRTMQCLSNVGKYFRYLIFEPMMNFNNLYQLMNMISYYVEKGERDKNLNEGVIQSVKGLKFVFPCNMKQRQVTENTAIYGTGGKQREFHIKSFLKFVFPCNMKQRQVTENTIIYGTGGQILASLKRLMSNLISLRELELIDLMLDYDDAKFLLDEVCNNCCLQLKTLILINITKETHELIHPGVFLNLNILVISPQNLGEDLIQLLGYTRLRNLHIKSNVFSPPIHGCKIISPKIWLQCKKSNPLLSVHIECLNEVLWQDQAPVKSLIFNSTSAMIQNDIILTTIEYYGNQIEVFAHLGIACFHRPKSFHDRPDSSLMLLCRQCPRLCTLVQHLNSILFCLLEIQLSDMSVVYILVIRERVSTATILLIASAGKQLRNLIVRRNAVIIKTDWPKSSEWTDEFYAWLKIASRKYESVEQEVSQILGYRWKMLSDKEFKKINIQLY